MIITKIIIRINNQNQYYNRVEEPPRIDPEEEFKNILLDEVSSKLSNQLVTEKKKLNNENQKMKNYLSRFSKENEKLQNFVNTENDIRTKSDEDISNMNNALSRIQDQIAQEKNKVVNEENCIDYLDIPDIDALKIIASETSLEEMVAIVRRSFERKKITFDEAINFTRNSSRDLFAIKFLKEKALNKYKN